ncbi:uncharacterized protein, partial [Linepithema humile]|uniref:uncharacterized protein n=1 Tax=Linepithema humile TaxID=83485 RepID=UPI00351E5004
TCQTNISNYLKLFCKNHTVLILQERILTLCRPEESELTLLLGGDCDEFLKHAFFGNIPVALVAETGSYRYNALEKFALTRYSYKMYENYNFVHFLQKLHRFVLVASSQPILQSILQKIKDSPWANSDGFFILIDRQTEYRGCINARSFLWTAWEYDLLSVIFICIEQSEIFYYTYNPYSNSTPTGWDEVERAKGRKGHPVIILKKKFMYDQNVCEDMDFDKTSNLKGYEIRLNAVEMEPFITLNLSARNADVFHGDNSEIIKILVGKLRAVLTVKVYYKHYDLGSIGPNGTLGGLLASVSDGKVDIGMNTRALLVLWKVKYTYPHTRSGLCVITQPIPEISQFTKLITFMSPEVIAGMIIICLLIYLIFAKNEGYIKAGLQVIRLVVCVGVFRPPKISSTRIFLCMALILFLNVSALFQSHLLSLLTVPVYIRDIDTLEGIKKAGYTLYGSSSLKGFISDPELKSRYVEVPNDVCKQHVENSSTAACLGDCFHLYYTIKGQDLAKSNMLIEILHSYVTREDWPLYNQVDQLFQHMNEAGLFQKSRADSLLEIIRGRKTIETMKKGFKVMVLKQLAFSFYILIIGYTCAIIVFILELVVGRSTSKPKNWKRIVKSNKENKEIIINREIPLQY